jgi:ABC-2 type transport system ATP-binding protein
MLKEPIIEIRDLTKQFSGTMEPAVKGISFSIQQEEIFGLLGPNGAGKTTTISILCGLFPPTQGTVRIDGHDLRRDMAKIRRIVGIVPQDIALYPTLTARENLDFYGHMYGLKGKDLRDQINYWLDKLGLSGTGRRTLATFSGGMKRRINLIAGVLHRPRILFLDEPTVGVDVQSRHVILGQLKELNTLGTTIIYTSHHLAEAENFCTHVSIIDHGRILSEGSPASLVASEPGCENLEQLFLHLTKRKLRD